jgi:hypothetical protein
MSGNLMPGANEFAFYDLNVYGETGRLEMADPARYRVSAPFPAPPVRLSRAADLPGLLLPRVGANRPARDSVDARVISEIWARSGNIKNVPRRGGPWPAA